MRLGLYLQGGGAKGAFQGGALTFLKEKGIKFSVISGTSIGAVNGYVVLKNGYDIFKKMYTEYDDSETLKMKFKGKLIDNSKLLDQVKNLEGLDSAIEAFYVNYVKVEGNELKEISDNIINDSKEDQLRKVSYSSSLPYNLDRETGIEEFKDILDKDYENINNNFSKNLIAGEYEGMYLDGGLLNNYFINDLLDHQVDRVLIIGLKPEEEYRKALLNKDGIPKNTIFINTDQHFRPSDTINFDNKFLTNLFNEGYNKAKEVYESGVLTKKL